MAGGGRGPVGDPIEPANEAPVADAGGGFRQTVGALISVDGTGSRDPDGAVLDYRWSWGDEVLVRAADLPAGAIRGTEWKKSATSESAGGSMLLNPDKGAAKRTTALASPGSYVEFTVNVAAGCRTGSGCAAVLPATPITTTPFTCSSAERSTAAGAPVARIGTTSALAIILEDRRDAGVSGWGWSDAGYGELAPPVYFAQTGPQTIPGCSSAKTGSAEIADPEQRGVPVVAWRNGERHDDSRREPGARRPASAPPTGMRFPEPIPIVLTVIDAAGASAVSATTVVVR